MKLLSTLSLLLGPCYAEARAVFAHFMVGNTASFSISDWRDDIKAAQAAHIDAFALNMAYDDDTNGPSLVNAFAAAESLGFKLFFSFDYAGNGPWPKDDVISLINQYKGSSAYYYRGSQPFVSTFEGPGQAADWADIKDQTGCFFIPDWSSLGAKAAMELGTADGLFSWAAWPTGPEDMNTYVDASYLQYLDGKPYMMPVSPWFFTNLPGYNKNWLWRGDDLWFDCWQQVLSVPHDVVPEFVEIISWNDYGESHYIGPLHDSEYVAFNIGKAPYNYALNMPHDGWRLFLPYVIDTYKNGIASITQEGLVSWYRLSPAQACDTGGTTGNTASQLQLEYDPSVLMQDKIFYSALLASAADVTVSIGGVIQKGTWENIPSGGIGIYHGSVPMGGHTGEVVITISRSGSTIASVSGPAITTSCPKEITNWNAWVGSATAANTIPTTSPELSNNDAVCIEGFGVYNFAGLCNFTCQYGYCPIGACTCTAMGPAAQKPTPTGKQGYPIAGEDASYSGLCSFACNYGYCPDTTCGYVEVPLATPTVSPFLPPACTAGSGDGNLAGLCSYACGYSYCPIHSCTCTGTGALNAPPPTIGSSGSPIMGLEDSGLCNFACSRGYCPIGACSGVVGGSTKNVVWTNVTCSADPVDDIYSDPAVRWAALDCVGAWGAAIKYWNDHNNAGPQFSEVVAKFFGAESLDNTMKCEDLNDENGCGPDAAVSCKEVNNPAGKLILNSFLEVNSFYWNLYEAIGTARGDAFGQIPSIADTFAPLPPDDETVDLVLDFLELGWTLVAGPAFNKAISSSQFFQVGDRQDKANEIADSLVSSGIDYLGDGTDEGHEIDAQKALTENLNNAVYAWQVGLTGLAKGTFNGSTSAMSTLWSLIRDGQFLSTGEIPSALDLQFLIDRAIYALLIPTAWAFSNAGVFVLDSGYPCSAVNPLPKYMTDEDGDATYVCYNDFLYYLMATKGSAEYCYDGPELTQHCTDNLFSVPDGLSNLTGTSWAGITKKDIVIGALNGYANNGNQNGWGLAAASDLNTIRDIYDNGIRTPGVIVGIPVCGPEEAFKNWDNFSRGGGYSKNYPCD